MNQFLSYNRPLSLKAKTLPSLCQKNPSVLRTNVIIIIIINNNNNNNNFHNNKILTIKRGKIVKSEGIKLPNGEVMKQVGQEGYTYLGIIELDKIKETEVKEKITKEYKRRQRLILKSKLNGRNKVTAINRWAVAIFRYGAGIIQWKASELKDLDRKSRKTVTMYGGLHSKSDIDRLYVKRKEGGRGLISVERCIREEQNSLGLEGYRQLRQLIRESRI